MERRGCGAQAPHTPLAWVGAIPGAVPNPDTRPLCRGAQILASWPMVRIQSKQEEVAEGQAEPSSLFGDQISRMDLWVGLLFR